MKKKKLRFLPYPSFFIMSSLSLSLSLSLQVALRVLESVFIILFSSTTHHPNISSYSFIYLFMFLAANSTHKTMLGPPYDVV
jgi:hypothetical protein